MSDLKELTPTARQLSQQYMELELIKAREPVINRALQISAIVIAAAALALGIWQWSRNETLDLSNQRQDALISAIQADLKNVCRKIPDSALAPSEKDSCNRAEANLPPSQVIAAAAPPTTPSQSFLDNAALLDKVHVWLNDYLATHPMPSAQDLLPLIRQVYNENKPADGRTPTDAELLGLVTKVYNANPPANGTNGKDATQDQADAAIRKYCSGATKPCQGPAGPQGVKGDPGATGATGPSGKDGVSGVSVYSQEFRMSGGACHNFVTYHDPNTNQNFERDEGTASLLACSS